MGANNASILTATSESVRCKMPKIRIVHCYDSLEIKRNGKGIGHLNFCTPTDTARGRNVELVYVEIQKKYRGQGYGTQLIKAFMEDHKDCVWISLWTSEELERAKGWKVYNRLGFKQLAYQADYYAPGIGTRLFAYKNKEKIK